MKILFEEYAYATSMLENILPKGYFHQFNAEFSKIYYVGYYNSSPMSFNGEAVIILPKIFLSEDEKLFGIYNPEILLDDPEILWKEMQGDKKASSLYSFSIWIFRAIRNYIKRHPATEIAHTERYNQIINNTGDADHTELGLVLSLFRFFKDNKNLFTAVSKLQNTGKNNINWARTSSRVNPIIQNENIIFTNFISKKKIINFDEELIIIFYSVLNYYKVVYGFEIIIETSYELITGHHFERLLENGTRKLKAIKYKYFNDRFVRLWNLLFTFFEKANSSRAGKQQEEILLIKDFNLVFEDMVDDLIGDKILPSYFKNQKDGKEIDHIYQSLSLVLTDEIYYIGDSKYYKPASALRGESVAKQFTYAKNIIQYNIDLFNQGKQQGTIRYRDELTEGYNITPNFFITALLNKEFNFTFPDLKTHATGVKVSSHFENRIFDRDSLYIQQYDINFLFVLSCYVSGSSTSKNNFKSSARTQFRENLIIYFNDHFSFFTVTTQTDIGILVEKYFKKLIGKMYRPSDYNNRILIAIQKDSELDLISLFSEEEGISISPHFLE